MEFNSHSSPKISTMTPSYNVRSISFPARSNPAVQTIQQYLNKLATNSPSSPKVETVLARISGLADVYKCLDNLLHLQSTQQFLSQDPKLVSEMLDDLIRFLDVCNSTKDSILAVKESVRQLQSSLRRSKAAGEDNHLGFQREIGVYFSSRKKMKKEAAKSLASLKMKKTQIEDSNSVASVVKALKETNLATVSVFNSLLLFLTASIVKPKGKKWPQILSKLVGKESAPAVVGCESQEDKENEMQKVERALNDLSDWGKEEMEYSCEKMESTKRMLESLDSSMGEIEDELECLFRQLIQCRVSLLNVVSQVQLE